MYLFLDDERVPSDVKWKELPRPERWHIVRNYEQFISFINDNGLPEFVAFDHDLADFHYEVMQQEVNSFYHDDGDLPKTFDYGSEKTGFDCAKWLVEHCHENSLAFPNYVVHSLNPVGAERIDQYINSAKTKAYII